MWERRAQRERAREREADRANSVRAIVLPCGKVTKEKCERAHRREGVTEGRDGEGGERDKKKGKVAVGG